MIAQNLKNLVFRLQQILSTEKVKVEFVLENIIIESVTKHLYLNHKRLVEKRRNFCQHFL